MNWFVELFRSNPEFAIFLTIGLGFWLGNLRYKNFSLGPVTAVLLVGVVVGQMDIQISGPMKAVFFLLFLFAVGYSVGPEFFRALKSDGIKQMLFAVILAIFCLLAPFGVAKILGYSTGEAVGLLSGSQTMSAVLGTGTATINNLGVPDAEKQAWISIMPVAYAVTYIFGTVGSLYLLSVLGPMMLGGINKVRAQTQELEMHLKSSATATDPSFIEANRPVVFRAYKIDSLWFGDGKTVMQLEDQMQLLGRRIFVDRIRKNGKILDPKPDLMLQNGDEVVLSGRREFIIEDESWLGSEVVDYDLTNFLVESVAVLVNRKCGVKSLEDLRKQQYMHGISIKSIRRAGVELPILPGLDIREGDRIQLIGLEREINSAAPNLGYLERASNKTDMAFVGIGIFLGCLLGSLAIKFGVVSVSLSTSGGALILGLIFGWLRTRIPVIGNIPDGSVWLMNNLGLNMFIAIVGITAGPGFVSGLRQVGFEMFFAGVAATSIPLILGVIVGRYIFKFHPAINLGCNAGGRTTTAALGAVQEVLGSSIPALGYTVTYAVGNTLLILWGVVIVLLMNL